MNLWAFLCRLHEHIPDESEPEGERKCVLCGQEVDS